MEISAYRLRKWSRFVKVRDKMTCAMCNIQPGAGRLESHHIWPKAFYPSLALELANGIALCFRCHRSVVHAEQFVDYDNWRKFLTMFAKLMDEDRIQQFNDTEQARITLAKPKAREREGGNE